MYKISYIADSVNYVINIDVLTGETETTVTLSNLPEPDVWVKAESE